MANFLKLAITGVEHFHPQYGKLVETGKNNGIQVFEQLIGSNKRVLTSVKDGEAIKQVSRTTGRMNAGEGSFADMRSTTTEARNFVTNNRVKIIRGEKRFDKDYKDFNGKPYTQHYKSVYRNVERQDVAGNWDELTVKYTKNLDNGNPADVLNLGGDLRYASYDIENGKFIEFAREWGRPLSELKAAQKDLKTGKVVDYTLSNGSTIPQGRHYAENTHWRLDGTDRLKVSRYGEAPKMEKNLANYIFNYFDRLTQKLNGVKNPTV